MINYTSTVQPSLPAFYQEHGPAFANFIKLYFEFLEQEGEADYILANLPTIRDPDLTPEEFLSHFKAKYLANIPTQNQADVRRLLRGISDLYASKGSKRSYELLFKLLFNDDITVTYPGDRILKTSDAKWYVPIYLEVTPTEIAKTYLNKQVIGSISGATAFVEGFARRNVGGRYIDVLLLSNLVGSFTKNDLIVLPNVPADDAPKMIGSLRDLLVVDGGRGFVVGEELEGLTGSGKHSKIRVTAIENATGRVDFELIEGGTGYTINANDLLSQYVFSVSNVSNANTLITDFYQFETIEQRLANVSFLSATNSYSNGETVTGKTSGGVTQAVGTIIQANQTGANGYLVIQISSGDFRFADNLTGTSANSLIDIALDISATANVIGTSANSVGIISQVNDFRAVETGETWIRGRMSNTTANITSRSTGSGAGFDIGSLSSSEAVFLYTDLLSSNNNANTPFMDVFLDGQGSGTGFVDSVTVGRQISLGSIVGTSFANNEYVEQVTIDTAGFTGTVSSVAGYPQLIGSGTNFSSKFLTGEWVYVANATHFDIAQVLSIDGTSMFVNHDLRASGGAMTYGKAVVIARGKSYFANTSAIRVFPVQGTFANAAANVIIGTTTGTIANLIGLSTLGGTGYSNGDTVAFVGGGQAVSSITINAGGTGYTNGTSVTFTAPERSTIDLFANVETFALSETVWQSNGSVNTALGTVYQYNGPSLVVDVSNGAFIAGANVQGALGGTSNVFSVVTSSHGANASAVAITNSSGGLTGFTIGNTGFGYTTAPIATVSGGTGANLTVVMTANTPANATPVTNSAGGLVSFTVGNVGANYYSQANVVLTTSGSGANIGVIMDYGYGFAKSPNSDDGSIMDEALSSNTFTIGSIASLTAIRPGTNYNRNPFLVVVEPLIAGYSKYDYVVQIANTSGTFLEGETISQNITSPISVATFTGLTGNTAFQAGEQVYQGDPVTPSARGIAYYVDGSTVSISDVTGTFVNTSNSTTYLLGYSSSAQANVTAVASNSAISVSRGQIKTANSTHLSVKRLSFNTNFTTGDTIEGTSSGTTAIPTLILDDVNSRVMGLNANVTANVISAAGVARSIAVMDSGIGYVDGEEVTFTGANGITITGYANTYSYGYSEGRYISYQSQLNRSFLQDNHYYQAYSYEIGSRLSIDKYFDMVTQLLHVAGTKMFGVVDIKQSANCDVMIEASGITVE